MAGATRRRLPAVVSSARDGLRGAVRADAGGRGRAVEPSADAPATGADVLIDRVLAGGPPSMLYQPVVDLTEQQIPVVGFEALARWPGLDGVTTGDLFNHATASDRMAELDWACRTAAIRGAVAAGIDKRTALFVNVEPAAAVLRAPRAAHQLWRQAAKKLTMVLEVTERRILTDPAALLATTEEARSSGWLIALDDLGANPDSLALLEFVRPDMVKLDLGLVQRDPDSAASRTLRAVAAYAERTGAQIIAEGIETDDQLERARSLGATLGQGYLFGRPGLLRPDPTGTFRAQRVPPIVSTATPYETVSAAGGYRVARRSVVRKLADDVMNQIDRLLDPPVCLVAVRMSGPNAQDSIAHWSRLGERSPLVVLLGVGMAPEPAPNILGAALEADDPLSDEWALVAVGAHSALAITARPASDDLSDDCPFRYAMTQDRDVVIAAGVGLLNRLVRSEVGVQ